MNVDSGDAKAQVVTHNFTRAAQGQPAFFLCYTVVPPSAIPWLTQSPIVTGILQSDSSLIYAF